MNALPTIVIIGRRNVGKSALFNRLIEEDKAIVSDVAGTTRDRTEGICLWRGKKLRVVDTGGLDIGGEDLIDREVMRQAKFAIAQADIILFMVDARVGPQPSEGKVAKELRQLTSPPAKQFPPLPEGRLGGVGAKKAQSTRFPPPVLLIANKAETARLRDAAQDPAWKRLGFDIPFPISAITGAGVGDLLDTIFSTIKVKKTPESQLPRADIKIAIIGKPNVGKSSLLNKILGEERVIISPIAHTTREPQDTLFRYSSSGVEKSILLIDTAGIRKKAKIIRGIEGIGVMKTLEVIRHADVVFFIMDATEMLDMQDKQLAQMIEETGVGVVIAINKHDLLPQRDTKQGDFLLKKVHFGLPGLTFAPVVYLSAKSGHGAHKLLPLALKIQENRKRVIPDEELETILPKLILRHKPTKGKGTRHPVIKRIEQTGTEPPTFLIVIGIRQFLHESYLRYVENRLREYYDFEGTPLKIWVKQEKA